MQSQRRIASLVPWTSKCGQTPPASRVFTRAIASTINELSIRDSIRLPIAVGSVMQSRRLDAPEVGCLQLFPARLWRCSRVPACNRQTQFLIKEMMRVASESGSAG